jgi:LEA14-like dessication related protein
MSKNIKYWLGGIGLLGLFYWLNEKKAMQAMKVSLRGVRYVDGKLLLDLQVMNPTKFNVTINSIIGDLFFNGAKIASVVNFQSQKVVAGGFSTITAVFQVSPFGLLQLPAALRTARESNFKLNFEFVGQVRVNGVIIPIDEKTTLSANVR